MSSQNSPTVKEKPLVLHTDLISNGQYIQTNIPRAIYKFDIDKIKEFIEDNLEKALLINESKK